MPSPEQMKAMQAQMQKLIDDLLARPEFGEQWARVWMDLARYADTKGYVFQEERRYPYAYTYRDYVIRSFNDDKPYDQFVREQLAGDELVGYHPDGDVTEEEVHVVTSPPRS